MNDDLKNALKKVLEVIIPYDIAREEERKQFNILKAMRSSSDEVRLHSRIIASLLDPTAPHDLRREPLRLFLECIEAKYIDEIIKDASLKIQPNYLDKKEFKEMDILITTDNYAVLIENKIWAGDSNKATDDYYDQKHKHPKRKGQLERYYALLVNEGNHVYGRFKENNIQVIYLTVDGHRPSRESTGEIRDIEGDPLNLKFDNLPKRIKEINYRNHILTWLDKLEHKENIDPSIRTLIKQYTMAINELTNVNERVEIVNAIGNLSEKERMALISLFRNQNEKHIYWHIADLFFQDLYQMMIEDGSRSMWIEEDTENAEREEVKNIHKSMSKILNNTVGPKGGKSIVHFYFSRDDDSPALVLNKGVIEFEGFKIDFNDVNSVDTINLSNEKYRKEIVKEVFEKMIAK